ncbi:hypothetical protein ABBQ38_014547 [Trebouxia sp. C0009 RCD-2024]
MKREDADVQRLEKILSKHGRKQSSEETQPRHSRSEDSVAEQPLNSLASESGMPTNAVREEVHHFPVFAACLCASGSPCSQPNDAACNASRVALRVTCTFAVPFQAQAQRQTGVVVEDLECSVLENALKEQVYRLTGQWQQGAQRLSSHLEEALHELAEVRQQENDLLKRRTELCHQELDDQVAQLERSFHLKVEQCKQQMLARIADQRADCEMAIQAKSESLLGVLEQVDAVPSPSSPDVRMHAADHRTASPHNLAHAACLCYEQDDEFQYSGAGQRDAQTPQPMRKRLNYLLPGASTDRHIPLSVQKYMHKTSGISPAQPGLGACPRAKPTSKALFACWQALVLAFASTGPAAADRGLIVLAQEETTTSALLFTSASVNGDSRDVDYTSCSLEKTFVVQGDLLSPAELTETSVGARWFGGKSALASDFSVEDCQTVRLAEGRSAKVYDDADNSKCQITWLNDTNYVNMQVDMEESKGIWVLSFPKNPDSLTRFLCTSSSGKCLIEPQTACTPNSGAQEGQDVEAMSIVEVTSACSAGSAAASMGGASLTYGLKATFYSDVYPDCARPSSTSQYALPDLASLTPDPMTPARCIDGLDYQVYNDTVPTTPALNPDTYGKCYGMVLDGYVNVVQNDNLTFLNGTVDDSFYNRYRVCVRYNGQVSVTLGGQNIVTSSAGGDFDATLVCQDDRDLQHGLVPLTVQYASTPTQGSTILQMFIIPVSQVWEATDSPDPSMPYDYSYNCSCCGLFGSSGGQGCTACGPCCQALTTCDFMTASCTGQAQNGGVLSPPSIPSPTPGASPVGSPSPSPAAVATPAATPSPTVGATPGVTSVASCNDAPPNSQYTCEQQAGFGKCGEPFMFGAGAPVRGYCAASCNRCPPSTSPSPTPSPSQAASPTPTPSPSPAATATPAPPETETPAATATPFPSDTPAPTLASCTDMPPNADYTCEQQAGFGKCGDPFMFTPDAPFGGYCAATCNRCPSSTSPAAEVTPAATPTPSPTVGTPIVFTPLATSSPTAEATPSPTPTSTPTPMATNSPAATSTPAATPSPSATPSATPPATAAATPAPTASPTSSPTATGTPAPSPGQTPSPSGVCPDVAPNSQYTCAQQAGFGKCGEPFMFSEGAPAGGYCAATCNRCPSGTSPSPSPSASPSLVHSPSPAGVLAD